jgi:hypothetical protein
MVVEEMTRVPRHDRWSSWRGEPGIIGYLEDINYLKSLRSRLNWKEAEREEIDIYVAHLSLVRLGEEAW